jgi:subtilisin family serine protease
MKVKSIQEVEIRANTPTITDTNKKGILNSGFEIEVVEKVKGQDIGGNDVWYKDTSGDYFWSGGFSEILTPLVQSSNTFDLVSFLVNSFDLMNNSLKAPINYSQLLDISDKYKSSASNDVLVAIVDTPINTNIPGLKGSFESPSAFPNLKVDHGTFIAGLIGGDDQNGVTGVAPHIKMQEVPAIDNFGHPNGDLLIEGIKSLLKLSERKNLIINVSMNIQPEGDIKTQMDKLCKKCIVVAAAGEDSELETVSKHQYPASNPNSISVGKYSKSYYNSGGYARIVSEVDVLVPEFNFISYNRSTDHLKYMYNYGDSCSCAIVTGVVSLLIGSNSCKPEINSVRKILKEISYPITDLDNFRYLRLVRPK